MENRIKKVMASVFGVEAASISENASPDSIEAWDSIHHLNLVVALEQEFKVQFRDDQIAELLNFKLIALSLRELSPQ